MYNHWQASRRLFNALEKAMQDGDWHGSVMDGDCTITLGEGMGV